MSGDDDEELLDCCFVSLIDGLWLELMLCDLYMRCILVHSVLCITRCTNHMQY